MRSSDWNLVKPPVVVINVSGIRQVKTPPVSRIATYIKEVQEYG